MRQKRFHSGPLEIRLKACSAALRGKIAETLELFTVSWDPPHAPIEIEAGEADGPATMMPGSFLTCGRMRVDRTEEGLAATCLSGAAALHSAAERRWSIRIPRTAMNGAVPEDVEDLTELAVTTGWRDLGFVPMHAGAIVRNGCCAMLCATSGGGKTTLTAAMVRRGWRTLGDDKLLLSLDQDRAPRLAALIHNFNLHPQARKWFPEVGDLTVLPRYSAWTEKRRVRIEDVWPGGGIDRGRPTHVVQVVRHDYPRRTTVQPMDRETILSVLLRQTVIPGDRALARRIFSTVVATAGRLQGLRIDLGQDAYGNPDSLKPLEEALA